MRSIERHDRNFIVLARTEAGTVRLAIETGDLRLRPAPVPGLGLIRFPPMADGAMSLSELAAGVDARLPGATPTEVKLAGNAYEVHVTARDGRPHGMLIDARTRRTLPYHIKESE